ncbi:TolB family protein [Paenibacillus albicereus]|uniref:TolB family protein n=1 Tax=Paenibacillus albicereus TaxID=2726185 RepID=A0A6H2H2G6_9BACL|nr:PD40 domain-containing protein [Paenibacillus albicereus]QJC53528.1 TolB family protein [Paenibacillus albicereus]
MIGNEEGRRQARERGVASVLETIDVSTGERRALGEFEALIEAPNWTPDGKRLIVNCGGRLYAYELESGAAEEIPSGVAVRCNNDHVLSPDGRSLAVSHHTEGDGHSRVYILPAEGGEPRLVTPLGPSYLHGWSPDGRTLAYCAERGGTYDVYVIGTEGGEERRLTDTPGLDDGPEYAPDGRLWFNSTRTGLMQLWRMEPDGSGQRQMTFDDDRNSWFPHPSPDGRLVAYLAYRRGDVEPADHPPNRQVELRLLPAEGGESRLLAELFGGQGTINVHSWSPDSRELAFVRYRPLGGIRTGGEA